jgi:class 3 adenylate cyclase
VRARVGTHVGECELHDGKPAGLAVATGARICGLGGTGDLLVSLTVRDLVAGTGIELADRGSRALKGISGERQVSAGAEPGDPSG